MQNCVILVNAFLPTDYPILEIWRMISGQLCLFINHGEEGSGNNSQKIKN